MEGDPIDQILGGGGSGEQDEIDRILGSGSNTRPQNSSPDRLDNIVESYKRVGTMGVNAAKEFLTPGHAINTVRQGPKIAHSITSAFHDVTHMFDKVDPEALRVQTNQVIEGFLADPGNKSKSAAATVMQMAAEMPAMLGEMALRPVEIAYGKNLETREDLSPDERAQKVKQVAGDALLFAVTHRVSQSIARQAAAQSQLIGRAGNLASLVDGAASGRITDQALYQLAKGPQIGAIGQRVLGGAIGGTAGGIVQGAVANANTPEIVEQMIAGGIYGLPLGLAMDAVGAYRNRGKPAESTVLANSAHDILAMHQIQYAADKSLTQMAFDVHALASADNVHDAVVKSRLAAKAAGEVVRPAIIETNDPTVLRAKNPELGAVIDYFSHKQADGTYRVYVGDKMSLSNQQVHEFKTTGLIDRQLVGYEDKVYFNRYNGGDGSVLTLEDFKTGSRQTADRTQVRLLTDNEAFTQYTSAVRDVEASKVVDSRGNLVVVDRLDNQDMFGDGIYAVRRQMETTQNPVKLDIRNPLNLDTPLDLSLARQIATRIAAATEKAWTLEDRAKAGEFKTTRDLIQATQEFISTPVEFPDIPLSIKLKQVIKGLGYDGIKDGDAWMALDKKQVLTPEMESIVQAERVGGITKKEVFDRLYKQFRTRLFDLQETATKPTLDETEADAITPSPDYDAEINAFGLNLGFTDDNMHALRREIEDRLKTELETKLNPEERHIINMIRGEVNTLRTKDIAENQLRAHAAGTALYMDARRAGMLFDREASTGFLTLRDAESNRILGTFTNPVETREFIRKAGIGNAPELITNTGLPTRLIGDLPPGFDGVRHFADDWDDALVNRGPLEAAFDYFHEYAGIATKVGDQMKAIDANHGTKLHAEVFDAMQVAYRKYIYNTIRYSHEIRPILKLIRTLTKDERELISIYRQTMSYQEMIGKNGLLKNRQVTPAEIEHAKWFHDNEIDMKNVYGFMRAVEKMKEGTPEFVDVGGNQVINGEYTKAFEQLRKDYNIDDTHVEAVARLDAIKSRRLEDVSGYVVSRLVGGMRGSLSRANFAKQHNMQLQSLAVAHGIDAMYDKLAVEFKFDDARLVNGYMNLLFDYGEGIQRPVDYDSAISANANVREFLSELSRSGELLATDRWIKDPIRALEMYIVNGFKNDGFNRALADAHEKLKLNLDTIEDSATRQAIRTRAETYLNEIDSRQPVSNNHLRNVVRSFLTEFGTRLGWTQKVDNKFIDKFIRTWLVVSETAAQGMRPIAGIRDFVTTYVNHASIFGFKRAQNALLHTLDDATIDQLIHSGIIDAADKNQPVEALAKSGRLPTLDSMQLIDPNTVENTRVARGQAAIQKMGEFGLKTSLQKTVYQRTHAGTYIEAWKLAGETLMDLVDGKVTKTQAYKKLQLSKYDVTVQRHFDSLVKAGKFRDAADYLARDTGQMIIGAYGAANHPSGWSTTFGRLFGQFGMWSTHQLRLGSRALTRGSRPEIFGNFARYTALMGALYATSKATGLDFSSFYLTPGAFALKPGPLVGLVANGIKLTSANEYERNKAIQAFKLMDPSERIQQLYIPFSYAIGDWAKAVQAFDAGLPQAPLQAAGFKIDREILSPQQQ